MKIYLIRHGQTTGDIEDRFGGDYDDHSTDLGKEQARELAEKIIDSGMEMLYYSPRIRAVETAEIVNEITNIPIEKAEDLKERNAYGILTGKLKARAQDKYPDLIEQLRDPKATIEGAEPYPDFRQRVLDIFHALTSSKYQTIGMITHGGVISCFLREILNRERKSLDDCAIIELNYENDRYEIIRSEGLELE